MEKLQIKQEDLPKGIKLLSNGQMEVEISFDITQHGHSFSKPRDYDISKVTKMIQSNSVQEQISNDLCKGYYGHSDRNVDNGYIPHEKNSDGEEVEPICVTKNLSINGNIITHTQRIFNTDKGIKVQKLLANGGGGFSNVWQVKTAPFQFFGYDFVVSPNFSGNSIIVDSICSDGVCKFDSTVDKIILDEIGADAPEEIKEIAKDVFLHSQDMQDTMVIRKHIKKVTAELDSVKNENITLKAEVDSIATYKKDTNEKLQEINSEMIVNQDSLATLKAKYDEKLVELDNIKRQLDNIKRQLDEIDITVKYDGTLVVPEVKLDGLFQGGNFAREASIDMDTIGLLNLKVPEKKKAQIVSQFLRTF